jgi:hypothetical protein
VWGKRKGKQGVEATRHQLRQNWQNGTAHTTINVEMKMLKSQNLTYETDQKVQNAVVSSCKKTSECPDCLFLLVQHANALTEVRCQP